MNVGSLLDRVYRATNWKYTDRFGIVDMFNDAQNQLTDHAKLEAQVSIYLNIDQESYALPNDFKSPINLIEGTIGSPNVVYPLVSINEYQFGYSMFNGEILIKPIPTEDKEVNFYYYKTATALVTDEDVPEFDSLYHHLLASYAIYSIGMMLDMGIAQGMVDRAKAQWTQGSMDFVESIARKNKRQRVNQKVTW